MPLVGVDIHHILPQSEGGLDTEENAAPLCPSCHEVYGANPQKRKLIREARDLWYEICATQLAFGVSQLKDINDTLKNVVTKEDLQRLAVRNVSYVLGTSGEKDVLSPEHNRYSFVREEFIHPLIIRELLGWLSDPTETIVGVDLISANHSNRFYGEFMVSTLEGRAWVEWKGTERESFAYAHIATSSSGVQIVDCSDRGGGTGVFRSIGLFSLECDRALGQDLEGKITTRARMLLKSLGTVSLGDRYNGEITYQDGLLVIGPDEGWFKRGKAASKELPIR
jgi:HNH endonuclease